MDATLAIARGATREADWRFLLPRPAGGGAFDHLLLLGGSADLDAHVAALGVARRVSRTPRRDDPADVVVVLADAGAELDSIAPCIADRAVVYWEVDRRAPGRRLLTPNHMRRKLAVHDLEMARAYWVKPGFPRRDMYLPFGRRAALRWYLETVYRATSRGRRLLKTTMKALAECAGAFATVAPCYALVAVRGMSARLPAVVELACAERDDMVDAVLLANGEAEWNRLVFLLFERASDKPAAVLKIPRTSAFNCAVEHEHSVLREVSAMLPAPMLSSIPASTLFRAGDVSVTAESCVSGSSVAARSGPGAHGALDDLRCAATWLASFHRETTRGHAAAGHWVDQELITRLVSRYEALLGVTPDEHRLLDAASAMVPHPADELPIVWQHGDFGPWNIYRDGQRVSVIDWEVARRGPALADLLYFVSHWSAAVRGHVTPEARIAHFAWLFCGYTPSDPTSREIYKVILDYMGSVGVPPPFFHHLLLYTVMEQAVERAQRLVRSGHAAPRDAAANEYIGYVGALARHADALFQRTPSPGVFDAAS